MLFSHLLRLGWALLQYTLSGSIYKPPSTQVGTHTAYCLFYGRGYKVELWEDWWEFRFTLHECLRTQLGHVCDIVFSGGEFLELSVGDVWGVYKLCVDESVRLGRGSRWCLLLSPSHMRTLHQITNIKAFWRKGTLIILVRVGRTVPAINRML